MSHRGANKKKYLCKTCEGEQCFYSANCPINSLPPTQSSGLNNSDIRSFSSAVKDLTLTVKDLATSVATLNRELNDVKMELADMRREVNSIKNLVDSIGDVASSQTLTSICEVVRVPHEGDRKKSIILWELNLHDVVDKVNEIVNLFA